jgi:phosphomannomutase / phosphoglucomutase
MQPAAPTPGRGRVRAIGPGLSVARIGLLAFLACGAILTVSAYLLERLGHAEPGPLAWAVLAGAMLALALVLLLLFGLLSASLRRDLATLSGMFRELAAGRLLVGDHGLRLQECRAPAEELAWLGVPAPVPSETGASLRPRAAELTRIAWHPEAVAGGPDAAIFGAYDIRGVVGVGLDAAGVELIGRAIGAEAGVRGEQSVVVAHDGRLSSPELGEALTRGLRAAGRHVLDIGRAPTPVLYFATHYLGTRTGVVVTGSHNPPEYNGLKIVVGGEALQGEAIQALRGRIARGDLPAGLGGGWESVDVRPDYLARILADVRLARPLTVVADCGSGVAGEMAPRLLRALGCEVIELHCRIDGCFPHHLPDPSQPENLADLTEAVLGHGADLGLAFDGDGDRLGVVDGAGRIIWPDRLLMLFAQELLAREAGALIVHDIKCSRALGRLVRECGGRALMWRTGHSPLRAKLQETGAALAGELSGHIFFNDRWPGFDDGLYAGARLLELLAARPEPPAAVFSALPDLPATPELRVPMMPGDPQWLMERLLELEPFPEAELCTLDGLRADFEEGWGLVRASRTLPCLTFRFEGEDEEGLIVVQERFRAVLREAAPELELPF